MKELLFEIHKLFEEMTDIENCSYFVSVIELNYNYDGEELKEKILKLNNEIKDVLKI